MGTVLLETEAAALLLLVATLVAACARWRHRRKLALAFIAAVVLLPATFWSLDVAARRRLAALRVEAGEIGRSLAPPRPPDRQNAAPLYRRAFEAMAPSKTPRKYVNRVNEYLDEKTFARPEVTEFLQSQRAALDLIRQAAQRPGCYFERPYDRPSLELALPEIQGLRDAADLLELDARNRAARGDHRAALTDVRAVLALAEDAGGDPFLVSTLVSYALLGKAFQTAQDLLARRAASTEEIALLQSAPTLSVRSNLQRALRMEEAVGLSTFGAPQLDTIFAMDDTSTGQADMGPFYRVFLLDRDLSFYRRMIGRHQRLASLPFYEAERQLEQIKRDFQAEPGGILSHLLLPAMTAIHRAAARTEAHQDVLQTAVAMHAYRARHKKFPDALDALAPEFLPRAPTDPFTGKPLLLITTDQGWAIYSVGPDKTDDGGAEFDYQTSAGDIRFFFKSGEPSRRPKPPEPSGGEA